MTRIKHIEEILKTNLSPTFLHIDNESYMHHVPEGSETHIKIVAVSTAFDNLARVARHRLINTYLAKEFEQGLHALSMHLYTPEEWEQSGKKIIQSPACSNGFNE